MQFNGSWARCLAEYAAPTLKSLVIQVAQQPRTNPCVHPHVDSSTLWLFCCCSAISPVGPYKPFYTGMPDAKDVLQQPFKWDPSLHGRVSPAVQRCQCDW